MSLMIGTGPNAKSKRSHFSNEAGIVFSRGMAPTPETEIDIRHGNDLKGKPMTIIGKKPRT